jgi:hypothetical protein
LFGLLDFALFFLFQATLYSPLFQEDLFPAFIVGKGPFQAEYAATRVVFIFRDGPAATVHNTAVVLRPDIAWHSGSAECPCLNAQTPLSSSNQSGSLLGFHDSYHHH